MRHTLQAALCVALLVGFYGLGVAVVAVLGLALYELIGHHLLGAAAGKLATVAVIVTFALVRAIFRRNKTPEPTGIRVTEAEQPRLWGEARRIAKFSGTRGPDEIWLIPEVNAAVSESATWLGLRSGVRRLYVGVPLVMCLGVDQLRSVLAHEFGHYSGRHTRLAGVTYRGQESLHRVVDRLGPGTLLGMTFRLYGRFYLAMSQSVSRRQELEADQLSAQLVGSRTAVLTLRQLRPLAAAWEVFLNTYVGLGHEVKRRPTDLFEGFAWFWSSPETQKRLDEVRKAPEEPTSIYDSHPSMDIRTAILSDVPDDTGATAFHPALDLFENREELLRSFEDYLFRESESVATPFPELVEAIGARIASEHATASLRHLDSLGFSPDLEGVVSAVRSGRSHDIVTPQMGETTQLLARKAGVQVVGDIVAATLLHEGRARFRLNWDGPWDLVDNSGNVLDPWTPARVAVETRQVEPLIAWLVEHDVRSNWTPDLTVPESAQENSIHALAVFKYRSFRMRVLYVTDEGLIIKRIGVLESLGATFREGTTNGYRNMLRHCAGLTLDQLAADSRAVAVPWARVRASVLKPRSGRWGVRLEIDGSAFGRLRVIPDTFAGDFVGALSHFSDRAMVRA